MFDQRICDGLVEQALDHTEHPADAASHLMVAAALILSRRLGEGEALDVMTMCLDEAGIAVRNARAH